MSKDDGINHPSHYTSHPSGVECISITRWMTFNTGSAVKYLWRHGLKPGESAEKDMKKAIFYIQDEIARLRGNGCTGDVVRDEMAHDQRIIYGLVKKLKRRS